MVVEWGSHHPNGPQRSLRVPRSRDTRPAVKKVPIVELCSIFLYLWSLSWIKKESVLQVECLEKNSKSLTGLSPQSSDYWSDVLPTELQRLTWGAESLVKFLCIPAGHMSRICLLDISDSHVLLYDTLLYLRFITSLYIIYREDITRWREDMKFIFEWKNYFTSECSERVKFFFLEKINFISSRQRVIFYLLHRYECFEN